MSRRAILSVLALLLARGALLAAAASLLLPAGAGILLNVVIVAVDLATILLVVTLVRRSGRTLRNFLGPFAAGRDLSFAAVTMLALFLSLGGGTLIGNALVYGGPPPIGSSADSVPLWVGLWSLFVMPVTVAIAEELLYRGWAQERLLTAWRPWTVIAVIALAFGVQHAPLSATSPGEAVVRVIATGLAGAALGIMRYRGVSLWALMIGHWVFDVFGLGVPAFLRSLA
ncbi:CPBP family intramembrane glutamic endopeptidase [Microbacterium sp. Clip185]|uniref:CPBP family intramembrane glutamic endopeptidase n=1 Tax=Microbacterium sp. Clip185 TaxID=3025663 RepID=UPI0023664B87|nr:CPBP family intramembrane glutamic endopeptidase [Microbacterium sp. Clip185]WDG19266.1 CPBP family intramembrane metalloprotease [Microbacterium sp. Clip185]